MGGGRGGPPLARPVVVTWALSSDKGNPFRHALYSWLALILAGYKIIACTIPCQVTDSGEPQTVE